MAIQNINELYDQLSSNENFSSLNFNSSDEFKSYLEELPEDKKQKFYNAWLDDQDISKEQFDTLLKKKESGSTGILSSALGSIDLGSPSVSKTTEPQAIAPEVQAPEAPAIEDVTAPVGEGPGKPLMFPTVPKGRTFEVKPVDEQFAGQKKQIQQQTKPKEEVVEKIITTQEFKKGSFGVTGEGKAKTAEEASQDKLMKDVQMQNPFKNNEFIFEVPGAAEEMDASGNIVKKAITNTKIPTDAEIGEVLFNNTTIKLSNPVDIGRISGRGSDVFDKETFKTYLQRKGLTPRNAEVVINNYIDKYVNTMSAEDTDSKLSKAKGETVAEKISNIRNQEDEYGLDLLAKQYGINVAEKARELQTFMTNRKRPGEAGYEQWNNQLTTLQKEMSNLVGGGEKLYNPEDGKLYDRASAPKRAMVYKAYLDDAVKIYKNTDTDKLKEIRSNLMDKVKFLEDQYDKTVGPEWRGKEFFKTFTSSMTEGQKEAMMRQFDMLDNYKAQLSAVNSRLLTNTDIEPVTTDRAGQFLKGLKKALPGGDYTSSYRTVKDDYGAYVDALEGEIQLKPEEIAKKELTLGEEVFKGIGYSLPIMAEIIASKNIAPSVEAIRASKYFRPITRGALKVTGSRAFANLFTDAAASAAHGYITYAPTSETGATGVGETLFSQTVWDKIGLEKITKGWAPLVRYLGKTAFGTVGETAEEFVGEYANALSETDFDWKKAADETFGKDISEFGKKLAVYASTSALMSSAYNAPALFKKSTRFNDVKKLAEEKLQNPEISEAEKEVIQASIKMMDATEKTLKDKEEMEGPATTVAVEPGTEMETFEGAAPEAAAPVVPGEEGVGPVEAVGPQPVNAQELNKELAKDGITDVSLQKVEDYGKEIESGNADYERFSPSEQRGLIEGGPVHVAATVITGKSDRAADTQDDSNDRQEEVVKEYAQKKGVWTENAPAKLTEKYGDPFQSGKESLVWLDEARGVVVKSSVTNQYPTLREALDSITLSNAYFPAAKITVVGFGTNKDGDFEIITEQPYIQGEDATEQEISDYFAKLGFTQDEKLYQGKEAFGNEEVIFKDAAPKNVIKTPDGNIVPIDLIAKINKPELNANGTRTVPSTVAEEVTEEAVTEQAPEVTETKAEAKPEVIEFVENGKPVKVDLSKLELVRISDPESTEEGMQEFSIESEGRKLGEIAVEYQKDNNNVKIAFSRIFGSDEFIETEEQKQKPVAFWKTGPEIEGVIYRYLKKVFEKIKTNLSKPFQGNFIYDTNQGKGIGKNTYGILAKVVKEDFGKNLISDTTRSEASEALWKSLERDGLAVNRGEYYEYILPTEAVGYGSQNKITTKEDYDQAVKNLRNPNLPSGFDFSKIGDLVKAAMYHIEAGSRKFADFTKKMVEQFGRGVRQYLPNVFRRANTQLQQQQAAAPTPAPVAAPAVTSAQVKQNINNDYNNIVSTNPRITEDRIGQELINRGYTLGQIKRFVPQLRNFYVKQAEKTFMDYVEQFQGKYDQRRAEIERFMESNPGLDYAQVYEQLKDQYSDFELFKMFYEDGADGDVLGELFGLEYKKTIQDAIESKQYNPDFLRDLDKDISSRKLKKNLTEARSLFSELQSFSTAEDLLSSAAEVLGLSGIEEAMRTMTDEMRADNQHKMDLLNAYGQIIDGTITPEQAALVADMLSFSGKMLRMGRGLFMTEKGLLDLIIKNLETVETKKQDYFTKKKRLLRVSEGNKAKLEKQVKEYFLRKKQFEQAVAAVDVGVDAVTEEAFANFTAYENALKEASTNLRTTINRLYGSRSPMTAKKFIAYTAQGVLSFATSTMGLITNAENNLALAPRKSLVAKVLGWTRVLAEYITKLGIYAKKGIAPTAYGALKSGGGVGIDPALYRSMAFEKGMREIADILYKGVTESTSSEKDFLKGYGEIDGVKDLAMAFRMTKAILKQFVPFGKKLEKLTEEEFATAFDKMLVALNEKDANGKPKLALLHSKGYDTVSTFLSGFFGLIPTISGRAIALSGDRVFYQFGYYEFLTAYANSKGITDPKEVQQFLMLNSVPEGDKELLQKIAEESGNRRIFANDNAVVKFMGSVEKYFEKIEKSVFAKKIQRIVEGKRKTAIAESQAKYVVPVIGKIAASMLVLFKRIPPNVIARYVRMTSGYSFIEALRNQIILSSKIKEYENDFGPAKNPKLSETKKKQMEKERVFLFEQMRKTERYWTEFLQALQLGTLVYLLIESGAISPPYGDDEEDKKRARAAGIAQQDASRLNISQLIRYVKGESKRGFTNQKGDISFDYRNLGILGFALGAYSSVAAISNINDYKQKSVIGSQDENAFKTGMHMIAQSMTNGVTQLSFIQTITSAISAFRGNGEKAAKDFATSLLSTAMTVPTLSYGAFRGIEKSQGISADPFRNYNPELEDQKESGLLASIVGSEVAARVWTKLTAKSPLYGFGLRDKEGNFIAPLEAIGFTPSKFYRPQIGPHRERLYKKNTFWDTRSGSWEDKFNAFLQATIDPFSFSDYEGFVSSVKPFEKNQEYRKGDFIEWNNNIWVVTKDKIKGVSPKDAVLGEQGDYILVDEKTKFMDPDQFRADQDGTYRTQLLFNFVELYEKATGDTKNYDLFSKLYKDPVKFKDAEGTMTVYIPMEEQRQLALMRGEAMRRSWQTEDLENFTEAIKKASENENITDDEFKQYVKEIFDDYVLGPLDNNNNRSGGIINQISENIKAIEDSPEYVKIMRDGLIKTIQAGELTREQFNRLSAIPEAASFINELDESKLKFKK